MKVAFFGLQECFDYFHISGFQSFIRRISSGLVQNGIKIDYILYGSKVSNVVQINHNWNLRYFIDLKDAIHYMSEIPYEHIIHVRMQSYIDRFNNAFLYKRYLNARYHYMLFTWPDSNIKRKLLFLEAIVNSRNGTIICVSPRLYKSLKKYVKNVELIFPPVPKNYFLKIEEKPKNKKIKVTFLGVIYPDKGIDEVIKIFLALKDDPKFEFAIYAIYEPRNKNSIEIRNWLKNQNHINYFEVDRYSYTPAVEDMVRALLRDTDIFIQPYRSLGATVDIPLLLLEAMASLCAVITTPLGNIPDVYGNSKFLIETKNSISHIISFLKNISFEEIEKERERIFEQNNKLEFEACKVVQQFIQVLTDNQ